MGRLILASASPRRRQLLEGLGLSFEVRPAGCDESVDTRDPQAMVLELCRRKAQACALQDGDVVIAADTVVAAGGGILGKPRDPEQARRMLRTLSGRRHSVFTGVAVRTPQRFVTRCERTEVFFRTLSERDIEDYIASGEPFDKAGGYGIQGRGGVFVQRIEGDFYNVMGLPLCTLCEMLEEIGAGV